VGARITDISTPRWIVWVNTQEVQPSYASEAKAISRGAQEAKTHHHVQVTLTAGRHRPRTVAEWVDGKRQGG
jgi:hypothetical protein